MKNLQFLILKLGKAVTVVLGVAIINFLLIRLAPGDPATIMAGEAGASDVAFVTQLREQFGLDKPLIHQLGTYLWNLLHGDLGYSYRSRLTVVELIADRLPATLVLMGCAFVFSLCVGVLLGVLAARSRYSSGSKTIDSLIMSLAMLLYATPLFWLSLLSIILFSVTLGWLPAFGWQTVGGNFTGWAKAADIGRHLILPCVTLGCFFMAVYARLTRASMLEVMGMDFVKTARAKGVPASTVVRRHVLRNALLPVLTFAGIQLGQMAGGAVLTETVFGWPGIGRLMFDALGSRDYQVLLGVFLVTAVMVVVFNLLIDVLYRVVDPRIGAG